MGELSLLVSSAIAQSVHNLDSSRCRNPSLEKRKEGWTEVWGNRRATQNCLNDEVNTSTAWRDEEAAISRQLSTTHPQQHLTLVQHRIAWLEQLVLRITGIPHVVVNSPYASMEATGPLPLLKDFRPSKPPVVVGRHHPWGSSILNYLQTERGVDLDVEQLRTPQQKAQAHMLETLVYTQLNPLLISLRYGDDDAWDQVYRRQYEQAASQCDDISNSYRPRLFSLFQAWSIRKVALKQLKVLWSAEEAIVIARKGFECLEAILSDGRNYLISGTTSPTTADALVWAHLADALCDVHLVIVLADYPKLVQFFHRIYEAYFRRPSMPSSSGAIAEDWRTWNQHENARNQFHRIPSEESQSKPSRFNDALELMQSLSVHTRDLQEVLIVSKEKRLREESLRAKGPPSAQTTLYRWRMGGDTYPEDSKEESNESKETPQQKKWRADNKYADELWVSGALAGIVLAVAFARHTT